MVSRALIIVASLLLAGCLEPSGTPSSQASSSTHAPTAAPQSFGIYKVRIEGDDYEVSIPVPTAEAGSGIGCFTDESWVAAAIKAGWDANFYPSIYGKVLVLRGNHTLQGELRQDANNQTSCLGHNYDGGNGSWSTGDPDNHHLHLSTGWRAVGGGWGSANVSAEYEVHLTNPPSIACEKLRYAGRVEGGWQSIPYEGGCPVATISTTSPGVTEPYGIYTVRIVGEHYSVGLPIPTQGEMGGLGCFTDQSWVDAAQAAGWQANVSTSPHGKVLTLAGTGDRQASFRQDSRNRTSCNDLSYDGGNYYWSTGNLADNSHLYAVGISGFANVTGDYVPYLPHSDYFCVPMHYETLLPDGAWQVVPYTGSCRMP